MIIFSVKIGIQFKHLNFEYTHLSMLYICHHRFQKDFFLTNHIAVYVFFLHVLHALCWTLFHVTSAKCMLH